MKILVLGSFGVGALENYYVEAFKEHGHVIDRFEINRSYNDLIAKGFSNKVINFISPNFLINETNRNVSEYVRKKFFDLILIFKGLTLFPETVTFLKSRCRLISNYNPDHPFHYYTRGSGNSNTKRSISLYDLHFSYSQSIVDKLKANFKVRAFFVPFGYYALSSNTVSNSASPYFLFVGAYDKERYHVLRSTRAKDILIYGDDKWNTRTRSNHTINASFQGRKLYGDELEIKTGEALAVINVLRRQNSIEHSHNMRTFEVPACGGVLLSTYTQEQASFFEPNKEALYFNGKDELVDILTRLRSDPKLAYSIKRNALQRCKNEDYSYKSRAKSLLEVVQQFL